MSWDIIDPFKQMENMHREMDKMFARAFKPLFAKKQEFRPAVADCYETENSVITCFELPGADKKDIELSVTDNHVEVKVEKSFEKKHKDKKASYFETGSSSFYRRVPLPANVDADKTKATYKKGVLRVEVPKKELKDKRKIEIE